MIHNYKDQYKYCTSCIHRVKEKGVSQYSFFNPKTAYIHYTPNHRYYILAVSSENKSCSTLINTTLLSNLVFFDVSLFIV